MLRRIINWRITVAERKLGVPTEYLRHIAQVSLPAFFKFVKIMPLAQYRRKLPAAPYHVARLVATRHEDCGTCVQIEVNLARQDGVSPEILRAVLASQPDQLSAELADVYHFASEVVTASGAEGPYRERLVERYGDEGLVELALGIAACRVFPVTKRALGYAKSCALVKVDI